MNHIQITYITAKKVYENALSTVENKLARVDFNGLEGRELRQARGLAKNELSDRFGLFDARKQFADAETALIQWAFQKTGVTMEQEILDTPHYRERIIENSLRLDA